MVERFAFSNENLLVLIMNILQQESDWFRNSFQYLSTIIDQLVEGNYWPKQEGGYNFRAGKNHSALRLLLDSLDEAY